MGKDNNIGSAGQLPWRESLILLAGIIADKYIKDRRKTDETSHKDMQKDGNTEPDSDGDLQV
jgi:hypothetical protein